MASGTEIRALLICALTVFSACVSPAQPTPPHPTPPHPTPTEHDLDLTEAHRLWREVAPETYSITILFEIRYPDGSGTHPRPCGISAGVLSVVSAGEVIETVDEWRNCEINPTQDAGRPRSVEELFDVVERQSNVGEVAVVFDTEFGFPRQINATHSDITFHVAVEAFQVGNVIQQELQQRLDEVSSHSKTWKSQNISSYSMVVDVACFCDAQGPWAVKVVDGDLISIDPEAPLWVRSQYLRIDLLFSELEQATGYDVVFVKYQPNGTPAYIFIDRETDTIDDELTVTISEFAVLP